MISIVSARVGNVVTHIALLSVGADPVSASSDHPAGIRGLEIESRRRACSGVLPPHPRNGLSRDCLVGSTA
jgi:hypothetical protein